ncbi:MAG TPA: nucleotidyltransferase family protein [Candidatus Thermoplasmatota archaeon]|nr:nucleotidyltransferase family protein [Candidatus Thermoplasmatota archaeon]
MGARRPETGTKLLPTRLEPPRFNSREREAYARALDVLSAAKVDYLLGGAVALNAHTGIWRETKDLDVFVRPDDVAKTLEAFERRGFEVETVDPVWLSKAWLGKFFIDVIHRNANGTGPVDDGWFERAPRMEVLGRVVPVVPVEELFLSKMFVGTRDRWDGADVLHIMFAANGVMDWARVLEKVGEHWELLLSYLHLFGYAYPGHVDRVPAWVFDTLVERFREHAGERQTGLAFRGTMLDPVSFLVDVREWGLPDARAEARRAAHEEG